MRDGESHSLLRIWRLCGWCGLVGVRGLVENGLLGASNTGSSGKQYRTFCVVHLAERFRLGDQREGSLGELTFAHNVSVG